MPRQRVFTDEERRERKNEQSRKHYQENKEKERESSRKYSEKNREKIRESQRRYRERVKGTEMYKKRCTISSWKQRGLIVDDYDEIYYRWLNSEECEMCGCEYKITKGGYLNKDMEHNHITGEFRSICCRSCNQKMSFQDKKKENNL